MISLSLSFSLYILHIYIYPRAGALPASCCWLRLLVCEQEAVFFLVLVSLLVLALPSFLFSHWFSSVL